MTRIAPALESVVVSSSVIRLAMAPDASLFCASLASPPCAVNGSTTSVTTPFSKRAVVASGAVTGCGGPDAGTGPCTDKTVASGAGAANCVVIARKTRPASAAAPATAAAILPAGDQDRSQDRSRKCTRARASLQDAAAVERESHCGNLGAATCGAVLCTVVPDETGRGAASGAGGCRFIAAGVVRAKAPCLICSIRCCVSASGSTDSSCRSSRAKASA